MFSHLDLGGPVPRSQNIITKLPASKFEWTSPLPTSPPSLPSSTLLIWILVHTNPDCLWAPVESQQATIPVHISQNICLGQNKNKYTSTSKQKEQCMCPAHWSRRRYCFFIGLTWRYISGSPLCVRKFLAVPSDTLQLDTAVLSYKLLITVIISWWHLMASIFAWNQNLKILLPVVYFSG